MAKEVTINVLFFASAREAAGVASTIINMGTDEPSHTSILRKKLSEQFPKIAPLMLDEDSITLAVNEEYITPEGVVLQNGDTVAIIPPISGG